METLQVTEEAIILWIRDHMSCMFLDGIMKGVSTLGNHGFIWILFAILMMAWGFRKKNGWCRCGFFLILALLGSALIVNLTLKPNVARVRPYVTLGLDIIVPPLADFSFPSGHTSAAFAAVPVFFAVGRKWGAVMLLFACVMAFSRLYLAVHYPTDILAGALIGFGVSRLILWIFSMKNDAGERNKS